MEHPVDLFEFQSKESKCFCLSKFIIFSFSDPTDSNNDLSSATLSKHEAAIRPSVHEIFAIPSSPTEFRHRTYSSSRSASNGSSISINSKKSWFTGK